MAFLLICGCKNIYVLSGGYYLFSSMKLHIVQLPDLNICFFLLFGIIIGLLSGCGNIEPDLPEETNTKSVACSGNKSQLSIEFFKTNNRGDRDNRGINHIILVNPKSPKLDFKVNVGLTHQLYAKDKRGKFRREYTAKMFHELVTNNGANLNGRKPIAAINADYIDTEDKPQGLNVSRGVQYAGIFKSRRSSFAISGGKPQQRRATIQVGARKNSVLNYNAVGGNGRFYRQGKFKNICQNLGRFACKQSTNRSMVAITSKGYVIFLVNDTKANSDINISQLNQELLPENFDNLLTGIARQNCLGTIQEGMLFDGGLSPGLYYKNRFYVENLGPIGSVFLIYQTK